MKTVLIALFFVGSLTAFAQNPIDGEWKGSRDTPNGTMEINYTFKVEGTELKGELETQFGEVPLENGQVDGKKFSYRISFNDFSIESKGELVTDDEIIIRNEMGEMTLKRVK